MDRKKKTTPVTGVFHGILVHNDPHPPSPSPPLPNAMSQRLNIANHYERKDGEKKKKPTFSSNEAIDGLNINDSTIEIVGFIKKYDPPKKVGAKQIHDLMKFLLINGTGREIECVAWNGCITKVKDIVAINKIIHLAKPTAKEADPEFNTGNVPFQLIIGQSTEVTDKGWYETNEIQSITWENIGEMEGRKIKISGWIKLPFWRETQASYGSGSITDGKQKLEVRITTWSNMDANLKKGDPIEVTGIVKMSSYMYLEIANGSAIVSTAGVKLDPDEMINIISTPRKRARIEQ